MAKSPEGVPIRPILNRTREHGNWFLHYNDEFAGDVLIRHKEDDHLQVKIPFEALKELVAEASKKARLDRLECPDPNTSLTGEDLQRIRKEILGLTVNQALMLE